MEIHVSLSFAACFYWRLVCCWSMSYKTEILAVTRHDRLHVRPRSIMVCQILWLACYRHVLHQIPDIFSCQAIFKLIVSSHFVHSINGSCQSLRFMLHLSVFYATVTADFNKWGVEAACYIRACKIFRAHRFMERKEFCSVLFCVVVVSKGVQLKRMNMLQIWFPKGRNVVSNLKNKTDMIILLKHKPLISLMGETENFAVVSRFTYNMKVED